MEGKTEAHRHTYAHTHTHIIDRGATMVGRGGTLRQGDCEISQRERNFHFQAQTEVSLDWPS